MPRTSQWIMLNTEEHIYHITNMQAQIVAVNIYRLKEGSLELKMKGLEHVELLVDTQTVKCTTRARTNKLGYFTIPYNPYICASKLFIWGAI